MNKRLFISHASEDKQPFVHDLAEALKTKNIDVWYDEYEIVPGMSIRETIDAGLSSCDVGLVVLSQNFFKKKWTMWELNGIIQKMLSGSGKLIPICYNITHVELMKFSPSLADILSLRSEEGIMSLSQKISNVLYPSKPVLIETRDILDSYGLRSPDYYDNWWLERIEFLGKEDIQYIPWALPKNPLNTPTSQNKPYTLAWACMRYSWIDEAMTNGFNQFTAQKDILEFIIKTPGVEVACRNNLEFLATYAPQLFFFDSSIKNDLEELYIKSISDIKQKRFPHNFKCELTFDGVPPTCNRIFALFDKEFGRYTPSVLLRHFVEGERFGLRPSLLDYWDVLIALCSELSEIYPKKVKKVLMDGFQSNYSALQLKNAFISKEPDNLKTIFSTPEIMEQVVGEIITDRKIEVQTPQSEIAKKICDLHLIEDYFIDRTFKLTIPKEELAFNIRGITFIQYNEK